MIKRTSVQIKVELNPKPIHSETMWEITIKRLRLRTEKWHLLWGVPRKAWSQPCGWPVQHSLPLHPPFCPNLNYVLYSVLRFPAPKGKFWLSKRVLGWHSLSHCYWPRGEHRAFGDPVTLRGEACIQYLGDTLPCPLEMTGKCVARWLTGSHIVTMKRTTWR